MMRKILLAAGIGWLTFASTAHLMAETAREAFDAIPTAVQAEAEAKKKAQGPSRGNQDPAYFLTIFRNARESLETGDENSVIQQIRQLQSAAASGPVSDACETVIRKLHEERAEKENAANAEASAALRRAGEAIVKAKVPKDLDATLQELARVGEKRGQARVSERGNDLLTRRVESAAKFVARWQDYLVSLNRNDNRQVAETLRSLMSDNNETIQALGLPRSEIVTRIPSISQSEDTTALVTTALNTVLERTRTLDDLPAAIRDLQGLRDSRSGSYNGGNNNDLNAALEALQTLYKTRLEFEAGLRTNLDLMSNRYDSSTRITGGIESYLVPLRAQLVALELPRLLGAPATEKPVPGETLDAFWRRLLDAAKKRGDWATVAQGLEVGRVLVFSANPRTAEMNNSGLDTTGFKSLLSAFSFETAGQYPQATAAYLTALNATVPDLPVALIGERLAALKKDHPKEYAEGAQAGFGTDSANERYLDRYYRSLAARDPASAPSATASPTVTPTPVPTSTPLPSATPVASPKASP